MARWKLRWKKWNMTTPEEIENPKIVSNSLMNLGLATSQAVQIESEPPVQGQLTPQYEFIRAFVKTMKAQYSILDLDKCCHLCPDLPNKSLQILLEHFDQMNEDGEFLDWNFNKNVYNPPTLEKLYKFSTQLAVEIFDVYQYQLENIHLPRQRKLNMSHAPPSTDAIQIVASWTAGKCLQKFMLPNLQNTKYSEILFRTFTLNNILDSLKLKFDKKLNILHWNLGDGAVKALGVAELLKKEPFVAQNAGNVDLLMVKGQIKVIHSLVKRYPKLSDIRTRFRRPFQFEWEKIKSKGNINGWIPAHFILDKGTESDFKWKDLKEDVKKMEQEMLRDPLFVEDLTKLQNLQINGLKNAAVQMAQQAEKQLVEKVESELEDLVEVSENLEKMTEHNFTIGKRMERSKFRINF